MKDCPKADVLNQLELDTEGGIEEAMRTIRGAPFAIDDQAAVAVDSQGKGIDIFAGSQVKQRHPDFKKWTPAIHQLTIWVGTSRSGFGAKVRQTQWVYDQDWGAGGVQ